MTVVADDAKHEICPLCSGKGSYNRERFGPRLTKLREERGWAMDTLARVSYVGVRDLMELEWKGRAPTGNELARLARVFRMGLAELVGADSTDVGRAVSPATGRPVVTKSYRRRAQRESEKEKIKRLTAAYLAEHGSRVKGGPVK